MVHSLKCVKVGNHIVLGIFFPFAVILPFKSSRAHKILVKFIGSSYLTPQASLFVPLTTGLICRWFPAHAPCDEDGVLLESAHPGDRPHPDTLSANCGATPSPYSSGTGRNHQSPNTTTVKGMGTICLFYKHGPVRVCTRKDPGSK